MQFRSKINIAKMEGVYCKKKHAYLDWHFISIQKRNLLNRCNRNLLQKSKPTIVQYTFSSQAFICQSLKQWRSGSSATLIITKASSYKDQCVILFFFIWPYPSVVAAPICAAAGCLFPLFKQDIFCTKPPIKNLNKVALLNLSTN